MSGGSGYAPPRIMRSLLSAFARRCRRSERLRKSGARGRAPIPRRSRAFVQTPGVGQLLADGGSSPLELSLYHAYLPMSATSSPKDHAVVVPARQQYSHSASEGGECVRSP